MAGWTLYRAQEWNPSMCLYFVTWGFFSWKDFLHLVFNFVTLFHKIIKYNNISFPANFLVSKTPFFTSQKLIFSFLVNFHQFQALSSRLQQILGKYGLFVYLAIYQRSSHLFSKNFPKNV